MEIRPVINHIRFFSPIHRHGWIQRGFLPLYNHVLKWAEDMKCPENCLLACHCHPMVQDERNEYVHHKLCTLTVIRAGLVTWEEITGDNKKTVHKKRSA